MLIFDKIRQMKTATGKLMRLGVDRVCVGIDGTIITRWVPDALKNYFTTNEHGFPVRNKTYIDFVHMDSRVGGSHTFGIWLDGNQETKKPDSTLKMPILANGNYPRNPSTKVFHVYIEHCRKNPTAFNMDGYNAYVPSTPASVKQT